MIEILMPPIIAFIVTFVTTPYFIKKFREIGLVSQDLNKKNKPLLPEMGGISVLFGLVLGISTLILFSTELLTELLAVLATVLLMGIIGILDGIFSYLGYKKRILRSSRKWRRGITQLQHALLPLMASIPLAAIKAGEYTMSIPFLGPIDFGLLYPFLIIPAFVTIFSNAFNMLAGMNGLEAGSGLIIGIGLLIGGIIIGNFIVINFSSILIGCLAAFLFYNFYPAKIFPGDITPFLIGAILASIAVVGNVERFVVIAMSLYYVEFLLKLRSRFKAQSFGIPQKDGSLKTPYRKLYSLTHFVMKVGKNKLKEKQIVLIILGLQIIPTILAIFTLTI